MTVPSLRAVAPNSPLKKLPGFGLLMIFQLAPSQRSVNVTEPPPLAFAPPTAQMSLAEIAAMPLPEGSGGVGTIARQAWNQLPAVRESGPRLTQSTGLGTA